MTTMTAIANAFQAVRGDEDLEALLKTFGLVQADAACYPGVRNLVAAYEGLVEGVTVVLIHRWHDPSQAFSIQPDITKLELRIGDSQRLANEYPDSF